MPETVQAYNQQNHPVGPPGTTMTAAASGTAAGTIIPVAAGAGVGSTTSLATGQVATDAAGEFTVTAAGTPAAGVVATINLQQVYAAQELPEYVCNVVDTTASPNLPILSGIVPVVASGQVSQLNIVTAVLTAAHNYTVSYEAAGAPGSS